MSERIAIPLVSLIDTMVLLERAALSRAPQWVREQKADHDYKKMSSDQAFRKAFEFALVVRGNMYLQINYHMSIGWSIIINDQCQKNPSDAVNVANTTDHDYRMAYCQAILQLGQYIQNLGGSDGHSGLH